jgi:phage terminase large subunit-like protein
MPSPWPKASRPPPKRQKMPTPSAPTSIAASLASLRPIDQTTFLKQLKPKEIAALENDFTVWAHAAQLPPDTLWRVWLFLGGRGAGKTRAGAEWVRAQVATGRAGRIALIAPTLHDAREVMVEGPSGLRAGKDAPTCEPSRRRLGWSNGAQAFVFSAQEPYRLRGPQFDAAWGDELCYWAHPDETLATLEMALRLGDRPRLCLTTTPKPIAALKALLARTDVAITRASTTTNGANLSPGFVAALEARFQGTAYGRQELDGELIEDPEGALWKRSELETVRSEAPAAFDRVVVAVDPPATSGPKADACGIVAAGAWGEGRARRAVVLADATLQGARPEVWAKRVADLADAVNADAIVAEANNGGDLVRSVLSLAAPGLAIRLVRATKGKRIRAEPIAALYAQGRVAHASAFPALEDEMCAFGAPGFSSSPDRLDALVWALTDLLLAHHEPRLRAL